MAGFLDALMNLTPEQSAALMQFGGGLLQAGGPSTKPIGFGQAFGGALQQAQAAMAEAEQRKLQQQAAQQQAKLLGLKIQDSESDLKNQEMMRTRQQQIAQQIAALGQGSDSAPQVTPVAQRANPFDYAAPAAPAAPASQPKVTRTEKYANRLLDEAAIFSQNGDFESADKRYQAAFKMLPQVEGRSVERDPSTGQLVNVITFKDGTQRVSEFGVKPDIQVLDLGGKKQAVDKNSLQGGQSFAVTQSPDSVASNELGRANLGIARQRLAMDQQQLAQGKIPQGYRMTADGNLAAIPGGPADPLASKEGVQRVTDARDVLDILKQAEPLIKKSTASYAGAGTDQVARAFGFSTPGAEAGSELKVLQGALVSKMPKMSGPQSDKDVQLYREMAGQIGDVTLPQSTRLAALSRVRELNKKYAGGDAQGQSKPRSKIFQLDGGGSAAATLGADGNYYVERGGKRYRVEE